MRDIQALTKVVPAAVQYLCCLPFFVMDAELLIPQAFMLNQVNTCYFRGEVQCIRLFLHLLLLCCSAPACFFAFSSEHAFVALANVYAYACFCTCCRCAAAPLCS
jgi:hypothetical protein